jgi:hypothetical protein
MSKFRTSLRQAVLAEVTRGDDEAVSEALQQSALVRVQLTDLYIVVHKTVKTSQEICDIAWTARARARRTVVSGACGEQELAEQR